MMKFFHQVTPWLFFGLVALGTGYGLARDDPKMFAIGVILLFAGAVINEEEL